MYPWPRRLFNFPIIMLATMQQMVTAISILWDSEARFSTSVHVLSVSMSEHAIPPLLILAAALAIGGFFTVKKITNIMCLLPQQLLLFLSAGSSTKAIIDGHFADGVIRSHAFLLSDQSPAILIAMFHAWAIMLIIRHGA